MTDELKELRERVRFALENINSLEHRNDVKGQLEAAHSLLKELCATTEETK